MRYLIRRIGFYLVALWASVSLNFVIPRLMPGDPAEAFLARLQGAHPITNQQLQALRAEFGISTTTPVWQQYFTYLNNLLHGDLGLSSTNYPDNAWTIIAQHLPWTIGLVGLAVVISFFLGTVLGIVIAWRRGTWLDTLVPSLLTFFSAIPYFWMALALLYIFSFRLNLFPLGDGYDASSGIVPGLSTDFVWSVVQHGILPAITLVIGSVAGWVLTMRNAMITTLSEDYVLMAQAKGLTERRVMFQYAARNAILPSITAFSMSLGLVVGGSILTEIVFNYPGIGYILYTAVQGYDYSLIEGCFLVIALTVLAANFLSELLYTVLDPRVRHGRG
jgi:peptide/nickel transport system permease protein